jgi:ABC transporter substrate binding protein
MVGRDDQPDDVRDRIRRLVFFFDDEDVRRRRRVSLQGVVERVAINVPEIACLNAKDDSLEPLGIGSQHIRRFDFGEVVMADRALDRLDHTILADAGGTADHKGVVDLLVRLLVAVGEPRDDVRTVVADHEVDDVEPRPGEAGSLAASNRLPSVYPFRYWAELGGLLSYGVEQTDNFRRAATYADRILKGTKPSDLPVQGPVKLTLTINLKTAKALGLDVPWFLQQRADEVIE